MMFDRNTSENFPQPHLIRTNFSILDVVGYFRGENNE